MNIQDIKIKITLSINGHGKMVERGDLDDDGNPYPMTYKPEPDETVWILGLKNAGVLSLTCPILEDFIHKNLGIEDLEEKPEFYLKSLNEKYNEYITDNRFELSAFRSDNQRLSLFRQEPNPWAYTQQTKYNGNKIFGGEPDNSRPRAVQVGMSGPTIVIHSIDIKFLNGISVKGNVKIPYFSEKQLSLNNLTKLIKKDIIQILQKEFENNHTFMKWVFPNIFVNNNKISYNFQIYDETCNYTASAPIVPRFDQKGEKITGVVRRTRGAGCKKKHAKCTKRTTCRKGIKGINRRKYKSNTYKRKTN